MGNYYDGYQVGCADSYDTIIKDLKKIIVKAESRNWKGDEPVVEVEELKRFLAYLEKTAGK